MTTSYTDVHPIKPSKKILRFNWFFWVFISIWSLSCYIKFALHISVCFSICSSIFVSLIFRASKELKESQRKHFLSLRMSPLITGSWNLRQYNKWAEIVSSAIKENIMSKGKCSLRVRAVCKSPHNHSPEIFPAFFFCLAAWLCHVRLFLTPWVNCSPSGSSTHGISRQKYWSGLPFPTPGDLLNSGIKPTSFMSPALASGFFTTVLSGKVTLPRCYSVVQLCPALWDPMYCNTPGLPVLHHHLKSQTHVHWVDDAIQSSHPL